MPCTHRRSPSSVSSSSLRPAHARMPSTKKASKPASVMPSSLRVARRPSSSIRPASSGVTSPARRWWRANVASE